jgi:tetratricopeptide (TPR) repeat protein
LLTYPKWDSQPSRQLRCYLLAIAFHEHAHAARAATLLKGSGAEIFQAEETVAQWKHCRKRMQGKTCFNFTTIAGLADCYGVLAYGRKIPGEEAYTKGMAPAQRALELDATLAEPHAAIALLREDHDYDWAGAEAEYKRAIELNPNYATAHHWYGLLLLHIGRLEEARQQIETARGLDPLSLQIQVNLGEVYTTMHQFDRAIEEYRKIEEMDPNFVSAPRSLADVYELKRMYREAAAEWQKFLLLSNEREMAALYEGVTDEDGYRRAVSQRIALLKERAKTPYVSPLTLADRYVQLGDKEQAIAWLEKAYQEHAIGLHSLKMDPMYDPLRTDPRFQDLLRRLHFPP